MATPIVWRNFLSEDDITWGILRGRMGYRKGDLIVKGDGSTPVIVSPDAQQIEWARYEAVEIQMLAEGGREIKIRIGNDEFKQPIPSAGEYHDYRFSVDIGGVRGSRPLAIMPTDSLTDAVAIRSIQLVPRKTNFPGTAGKLYFGKSDEYRNVLYAHAPSSLNFDVAVPQNGRLHFGIGVGSLVLLVNIILLTLYLLSCHSLRHLIGGKLDCFSCTVTNRGRHGAWKKASFLNERHMLYAWCSLITVGFADFYVRMVASGMIKDFRIL